MSEFFTDARSMITLVSFVTFVGIIWWTYVSHKPADFSQAEMLPFADGDIGQPADASGKEARHG
ncbi:CcoQ/FixQ family Cbb3-type cytochrome c oxidase assembly chaperone [Herbaspirillum sp. LeCh32-8]|uniref:cbb3-type cytochrome oxidase subunit 3 n=1 Tax=Herbaspirillum sp. LeCh32-8 TaxID=2821356 RepID=UPI001AE3CC8E|nr:CcoQ/FixQ family Cbb3-type cytochrome c oxidase assembly chaperone [Herbaspirillum sp. LeCh32-8]MBP0596523.1 CcoQ/FixQ family Cbb3-type cytochrome c oxidase assembly chaperone [Herbaspirillum sp. LeCh32-8]